MRLYIHYYQMKVNQVKIVQKAYINRIFRSIWICSVIIFLSMLIGVFGYHYLGGLGWVDSILNAAMILTGMGPVDPMRHTVGKLFASFYALFSGIVFLSSIAVLVSPLVHQFMFKLHVEEDGNGQG